MGKQVLIIPCCQFVLMDYIRFRSRSVLLAGSCRAAVGTPRVGRTTRLERVSAFGGRWIAEAAEKKRLSLKIASSIHWRVYTIIRAGKRSRPKFFECHDRLLWHMKIKPAPEYVTFQTKQPDVPLAETSGCIYYFRILNSEIISCDLSRFARRCLQRQMQNMASTPSDLFVRKE